MLQYWAFDLEGHSFNWLYTPPEFLTGSKRLVRARSSLHVNLQMFIYTFHGWCEWCTKPFFHSLAVMILMPLAATILVYVLFFHLVYVMRWVIDIIAVGRQSLYLVLRVCHCIVPEWVMWCGCGPFIMTLTKSYMFVVVRVILRLALVAQLTHRECKLCMLCTYC